MLSCNLHHSRLQSQVKWRENSEMEHFHLLSIVYFPLGFFFWGGVATFNLKKYRMPPSWFPTRKLFQASEGEVFVQKGTWHFIF